ncbi:unnamed protein product [Haemonchus placei]|uniref:Uncharacterized protein n=1 Tax=Haemonchus placei TaxID=6290 RepID=A0A0N4W0C7_HAEPC|nr:unnamed protein product [Haemonchus placei]
MVSKAIRTGALERVKQASEDVEAVEQPQKKQLRVDQQGDQVKATGLIPPPFLRKEPYVSTAYHSNSAC